MTGNPLKQARTGKEADARLSLNLPKRLHIRVKAGCALESKTITEVVLELLEGKFPAKPNE